MRSRWPENRYGFPSSPPDGVGQHILFWSESVSARPARRAGCCKSPVATQNSTASLFQPAVMTPLSAVYRIADRTSCKVRVRWEETRAPNERHCPPQRPPLTVPPSPDGVHDATLPGECRRVLQRCSHGAPVLATTPRRRPGQVGGRPTLSPVIDRLLAICIMLITEYSRLFSFR